MTYFNTWILFCRAILSYSLLPSHKSTYYLAGKKLFALSFRYREKDKKSFIFFIKQFINSLFIGSISSNETYTRYNSGSDFFYDDIKSHKNEETRRNHIKYFSKKDIDGAIWKNTLAGYFTIADKLCQLFFLLLLFVITLPVAIFITYRGSAGMIFIEYIELTNLLKVVKSNNIKTLYYYSIYHKDSGISGIALQKAGVKVIKLTSLTPIKYWNSTIVGADSLVLLDVNQLDEVETFRDTIKVKNIEVWGPENINTPLVDHYRKNGANSTPQNTIGFYSTASYIRHIEGSIEQYITEDKEDTVKKYLAEYLTNHTNIKLTIFPHPKEKRKEYENLVKEHYNKIFSGISYNMADYTVPSSISFETVDLGVAMYSSIMYERLFFGFKCIMMPLAMAGNELPGKAIANICAKDKEDLHKKIDTFLHLTSEQYFESTGIKKSVFMKELEQPH